MRCAYRVCNSDTRYKHKDYMRNVYFIPFIKPEHNLKRCKLWILACGRKNFTIKNINKNTYICTKHFIGGGPTKENPDPILTIQKDKITKVNNCTVRNRKLLIEENESNNSQDNLPEPIPDPEFKFEAKEVSNLMENNINDQEYQTSFSSKEVGTQTICKSYAEDIDIRRSCSSAGMFKMSYDICSQNEDQFKYFCGLNLARFNELYALLEPEKITLLKYIDENNLPRKQNVFNHIPNKTKLFLLLVRLRRGYTLQELSYFFDISLTFVSSILYTWIQFVYSELKVYKRAMFLTKNQQNKFKGPFVITKNLRVIIDCTEIHIEMSQSFEQSNTDLNYKHCNTVKFLVGIAKNGAICYVSDGYEGAKSDVDLFQECDISEFLEPGDAIIADRGFTIQNILDPLQVKLILPPCLNGRETLSLQEELLSKKIAKCRIFVQRIVSKIKCYRLFHKTLPNTLLPLLSQMFFITCFLVNFEQPSAYNEYL